MAGWVFLEKEFFGKQIMAVKGAVAWVTGGDIETSR